MHGAYACPLWSLALPPIESGSGTFTPVEIKGGIDMSALHDDRVPAEPWRLLATARAALDLHTNNNGECAVRHTDFPCERASRADLALSAF